MIADLKPYPAMKDSGVPWLGDVPGHWEVIPIGRVGTLLKGTGGTKADDVSDGVPCVRYGDLYTKHKFFIRSSRSFVTQERSADYTPILFGDVLFAGSGETIEEIGKSAVSLLSSPACCGGDVLVLRPTRAVAPEFLGYASDCHPVAHQKAAMGRGVTVKHIYSDRLKYLCLPFPPLPEQSAIVRFLDHADLRISRYIRAKQKLIKLLNEQKQAIIHRAVTRGLDPNVRLKPSGVEWLGDVPEHWDVRKLGQIAISIRTGPFGSILHQSDYVEGGTPVINPTHMNGGRIVEDPRSSVPPAVADRLSNYRLDKHDLIFSRRGELGRCALVRGREVNWLCGTGSIRVRVAYEGIEPEYLIQALQVRRVGEYLSLFSVGATMESLNTGILKGVPVLVPPADEQRELLDHIAREARDIDRATADAEREIALLREYRTRLVADIVTGKVDVRDAVASLPDEAEEPDALDDADTLAEGDDATGGDPDSMLDEVEA